MLRKTPVGLFRVECRREEKAVFRINIGKADAILKLLASQPGQTFTLDQLIEAIWGSEIEESKTDAKRATANLYRCISELRQLLEPHKKASQSQYILRNSRGYWWNSQAECRVDAQEFQKHLDAAQRAEAVGQWLEMLHHYEKATALYQGDYLAVDLYAEWTIAPRQHWRELCLKALAGLAESYARLGQYSQAIAQCQKVLELKPTQESVYRQKMLYQYLKSESSEALETYLTCVSALKEGLDVEPAPETRKLYETIRNAEVPAPAQGYPPPATPARHNLLKRCASFSDEVPPLLVRTGEEARSAGGGGPHPGLPPSLPTGEGVFCTEKLAHGVTYVAVTSIHEWRIRWGSADEAKPQRSDYEEYISQC